MSSNDVIPEHTLPIWMQQARRRVDWGVLIVLAVGILAAANFLLETDPPRIHQHENYLFRSADYAESLREGYLYPRWAAHVLQGYGAPVYHYYPPAAPYLTAVVHLLFTNNLQIAARIIYVLAFALAAASVYALVQRQQDATAGLIAAMLYVLSPYVGLTIPQIIGDMNLMLAGVALPVFLWSLSRLFTLDRPYDLLFCALATAILMLTYPLLAGAAFVFASIWLIVMLSRTRAYLAGLRTVVTVLIGVGLAAFFWMPALLEYDLVTWLPPLIEVNPPAITARHLFSPMYQVNSGVLQPLPQYSLGLLIPVLAVAAIFVLLRHVRQYLFQALSLSYGLLLLFILLIFTPAQHWLLLPVTLFLAIGCSPMLHVLRYISPPRQRLFVAIVMIVILMASLPVMLGVPTTVTIGAVDANAQLLYEQQAFGFAPLPANAALPSTLNPTAEPSRYLLSGYQNRNLDRLAPNQISARFQASVLSVSTHQSRYQVLNGESVLVQFLQAYFPGWRATLAGIPQPIRPNEAGLTQVVIQPTDTAELTLRLGTTQPRQAAWVVSLASLLLTLILTWGRVRRQQAPYFDRVNLLAIPHTRLYTVVVVIFLVGFFVLSLLEENPLRDPAGEPVQRISLLGARTNAGLELIGYELGAEQFQAGEVIHLTLYWQALQFLPETYQVRISLVDTQQGSTWLASDLQSPGNLPTRRWVRNLYLEDPYQLTIPDAIPAGNYVLTVEVVFCDLDCSQENRLIFFDNRGTERGTIFTLPPLLSIE